VFVCVCACVCMCVCMRVCDFSHAGGDEEITVRSVCVC